MALVNHVVSGGIAHLELNRPGVANAFDLDATREFMSVVQHVSNDGDVRSVMISGAGDRFCAGGDVHSFAAAPDQAAYVHRLAIELDEAFRALESMEKPIVASVHGAVAGAGLALMLSCDVIIAAPTSKFVFAYPGIGFTPDCGVSYLLPRAMGQQRALLFALSGRAATAQEAVEWGLVSEVAEDADERARELAAQWAAGPAVALGNARRLMRQGWGTTRVETGVEEARTITEMVKGEEARRLIARFVGD